MKPNEPKITKVNYGAMTLEVESKTADKVNYEVIITDATSYRETKVADKVIAILKFNANNPDSLVITKSSKSYSENLRVDMIRTSLFRTFFNININMTDEALTTSIEKDNILSLNKAKKSFWGYTSQPKVLSA